MRPLPGETGFAGPRVQRIAEEPFSVVRGPSGSYRAESLAGLIAGWRRWQDCVWLRTPSTRPLALASPLLTACRYRWGGDEAPTPAGPAADQLDQALRLAPPGGIVVLELEGWAATGLVRLGEAVRPAARDRGVQVIAVAQPRLPALAMAGSALVVPTAELGGLPGRGDAGLPGHSYDRLLGLAGRRVAVVHDVLDAARTCSAEVVADAIGCSQTLWAALDRLTANLLERATPGQRAALEVCAATGYWHPQLAIPGASASMLRPWVVPLELDWGWLRPIWSRPLRRQLAAPAGHRRPFQARIAAVATPPPCAPAPARPVPPGLVEARLLGAFQLRVDGRPVTGWPGQRGPSVLRFLLSRPRHRCSRDELLAEFWPEVAPEAARNRLQVAVSGLRRALTEVTRVNVIEYANGGYRINPELLVEVDVERFEGALSAARRAERSGAADAASAAYREAADLYQGDFVSDAPYEQWTVLPRERLRLSYLDALDRMSRIHLRLGRLDDCIATGLRMLAVDPCREDAHRLLMRCYANQGRTYQALRQYEFCTLMLKATLDTGPSAETVQAYRSIRTDAAIA
jgi:DNA-binding SARP family transcriptional activator